MVEPKGDGASDVSTTRAALSHVLVIEDSDADFALLEREIAKLGPDVVLERVSSEAEFRSALARTSWDAIISDHALPQFSSTDALEILVLSGEDSPFIILSGAIGEERAVQAMKAGAKDCIAKANLGRLIPVLEREWGEAQQRAARREAEGALQSEREARLQQRSALLEITNALLASYDRRAFSRVVAHALSKILPCDRILLVYFRHNEEVNAVMLDPRSDDMADLNDPSLAFLPWDEISSRPFEEGTSSGELPRCFEPLKERGMRSFVAGKLAAKTGLAGYIALGSRDAGTYTSFEHDFFAEACSQIAIALENLLSFERIRALKERLEREKRYLVEEIKTQHNFEIMVGTSPALRKVEELIRQIASTPAPVLVSGETGTGKELVVRALHHLSSRRDRPLVKVNCAAISSSLVESELFGHVRGAFTGAVERRVGRFELAHGGILFLDEVGELPLESQAKLLRVLQEQEFEPVGSSRTIRVDVRVFAATNRNLEEAIRQGQFRSDLFYRLNVFPIAVPPLRERKEDIPRLAAYFLERSARQFGKPVEGITDAALARLSVYSWPGNIRELENVIARAVVLTPSRFIAYEHVPVSQAPGQIEATHVAGVRGPESLAEAEKNHILMVLRATGWVIEGANGAAKRLGLQPSTLRGRMKKLGIQRP